MRRLVPVSFLAASALLVAACESQVDLRGFAPTPGAVEKLEVGSQSRDDVVRLIGTPSAVATFNPNVWYFISQRQETFAFLKPEITEQKIMQVTFNDAGRISDIKHYDLKDSKDIAMVARVTPTAGKELTVLEQILGNIGKFSGPKKESNPGAPTSGGI
jgi:outer membrane protein assembly factor BamE (lipoprotein component of BamABCDE complex)